MISPPQKSGRYPLQKSCGPTQISKVIRQSMAVNSLSTRWYPMLKGEAKEYCMVSSEKTNTTQMPQQINEKFPWGVTRYSEKLKNFFHKTKQDLCSCAIILANICHYNAENRITHRKDGKA